MVECFGLTPDPTQLTPLQCFGNDVFLHTCQSQNRTRTGATDWSCALKSAVTPLRVFVRIFGTKKLFFKLLIDWLWVSSHRKGISRCKKATLLFSGLRLIYPNFVNISELRTNASTNYNGCVRRTSGLPKQHQQPWLRSSFWVSLSTKHYLTNEMWIIKTTNIEMLTAVFQFHLPLLLLRWWKSPSLSRLSRRGGT